MCNSPKKYQKYCKKVTNGYNSIVRNREPLLRQNQNPKAKKRRRRFSENKVEKSCENTIT